MVLELTFILDGLCRARPPNGGLRGKSIHQLTYSSNLEHSRILESSQGLQEPVCKSSSRAWFDREAGLAQQRLHHIRLFDRPQMEALGAGGYEHADALFLGSDGPRIDRHLAAVELGQLDAKWRR